MVIRSLFLDFISDLFYYLELEIVCYINDGLMIIFEGRVFELGIYNKLKFKYFEIFVIFYLGMLILLGFIDIYIYYF